MHLFSMTKILNETNNQRRQSIKTQELAILVIIFIKRTHGIIKFKTYHFRLIASTHSHLQ
jgi:hypothetical protein